MNLQDLIDTIEQYIVENGNNEITANTLRPILVSIAEFADSKSGDLSQLETAEKSDLVKALNEVLDGIPTATNGDSPELRVNDGWVQWKLLNDAVWSNLYKLTELLSSPEIGLKSVTVVLEDMTNEYSKTALYTNQKINIQRIHSVLTGSGEVDYVVYHSESRNSGEVSVTDAEITEESSSTGTTTTEFTSPGVSVNEFIYITIKATSGTPESLTVTIFYE